MKYILFTLVLLGFVFSSKSSAQEETMFDGKRSVGGFLAVNGKLSKIQSETAFFLGGKAGIVLNKQYVLGIAGFWNSPKRITGFANRVRLNYGGFFFEYILNSNKLVHFVFGGFGGAGDLAGQGYKTVYVIEPEVTAVVNLARGVRFGLGASYIIAGKGAGLNKIGGFSYGLTLRLGSF